VIAKGPGNMRRVFHISIALTVGIMVGCRSTGQPSADCCRVQQFEQPATAMTPSWQNAPPLPEDRVEFPPPPEADASTPAAQTQPEGNAPAASSANATL